LRDSFITLAIWGQTVWCTKENKQTNIKKSQCLTSKSGLQEGKQLTLLTEIYSLINSTDRSVNRTRC